MAHICSFTSRWQPLSQPLGEHANDALPMKAAVFDKDRARIPPGYRTSGDKQVRNVALECVGVELWTEGVISTSHASSAHQVHIRLVASQQENAISGDLL